MGEEMSEEPKAKVKELKKENKRLKKENKSLKSTFVNVNTVQNLEWSVKTLEGKIDRITTVQEDLKTHFLSWEKLNVKLAKSRNQNVVDSAKYEIFSKVIKHIRKCKTMEEVEFVMSKVDEEFVNKYEGIKELLVENRYLKNIIKVILLNHDMEECIDMFIGSFEGYGGSV